MRSRLRLLLGLLGAAVLVPTAIAPHAVVAMPNIGIPDSGSAALYPDVRTLAEFVPSEPAAYPEGLAIDAHGNIYVGMIASGEIVKIAPNGDQSRHTKFPMGTRLEGAQRPGLIGITMFRGDIYAVLLTQNAPGAATHGVWRVRPDGSQELVAEIPNDKGLPNQIAVAHDGTIFVTDSALGTVWRIKSGERVATAWVQDPRLLPKTETDNPCQTTQSDSGANGLAFGPDGELYVASANRGTIVRVDSRSDTPLVETYIQDCARLTALDHIAFDVLGNLYAARNLNGELVKVSPWKSVTVLADGLKFPSNVVFGTGPVAFGSHPGNVSELYFTNLGPAEPSLKVINVGIPGLPLP